MKAAALRTVEEVAGQFLAKIVPMKPSRHNNQTVLTKSEWTDERYSEKSAE